MSISCNRRRFLGATAGLALASPSLRALGSARAEAPTAPVALAKCKTYDEAEVRRSLDSLFKNLGGLSKLVSGKTVTVKVNLTGDPKTPALGRTAIVLIGEGRAAEGVIATGPRPTPTVIREVLRRVAGIDQEKPS